MEEVRHISTNLGVNPHLIRVTAFPPEDMTTNALKAFLHDTGSLLSTFGARTKLWTLSDLFTVRKVSRPQQTRLKSLQYDAQD